MIFVCAQGIHGSWIWFYVPGIWVLSIWVLSDIVLICKTKQCSGALLFKGWEVILFIKVRYPFNINVSRFFYICTFTDKIFHQAYFKHIYYLLERVYWLFILMISLCAVYVSLTLGALLWTHVLWFTEVNPELPWISSIIFDFYQISYLKAEYSEFSKLS